ncbi:MAG: MFS transporter [Ignavibacteriae bacterium]|nr:MFS transporter [Ignavibacteriota bacterium]NOG97928.1 MFS transporter [Ignavibacteriota bacterium]
MTKQKFLQGLEKAYSLINNEEDARICKDISEDACRYVPSNFFLIIVSNTLTKLGDALGNPKTVLAWLMGYVNAPLYLISFLVPIRESGSMLPQIFIASYVRQKPLRKWVWVVGSILQFVSMAGIGIAAVSFTGATAGWIIILLLMIFSLSRGLCSVSSKDVMGKTIPKTRRGRLKGFSTAISGIFVLAVGLFMILKKEEDLSIEFYGYLIFFAGVLWVLAAAVYSRIKEYPGETSGGGNAFKEAIARLDLLKNDKPFRNFVIARSLLLSSALTAPFYVVIAQSYLGKDIYILGLFIIAGGIASIISAPIWGKMADDSSRRVMIIAVMIASVLGIAMFVIMTWIPFLRDLHWIYPFAFFILGIAHSGVRLGRKTYIIDMAGGNRRTDYVAVSNTIIGFVLLITGGISALASIISPEGIILVLSLFGLAGAYTSNKLPDVQ